MSEPVAIFSSAEISRDDYKIFIHDAGGKFFAGAPDTGVISKNNCHLWIYFGAPDVSVSSAVHSKLGGQPKSAFIMEISRNEHSDILAVEFACKFCARWPAVVDDLRPQKHIYTYDDLLRMRAEGKTFCLSPHKQSQ